MNKNYLLGMVTIENVSLSRRCWRLDKRVVFSGLLQEFIQTSVLYRLLSVRASIQILFIQVKIYERGAPERNSYTAPISFRISVETPPLFFLSTLRVPLTTTRQQQQALDNLRTKS